MFAIFFQSFPYFCNPSRKSWCSVSSHRPMSSAPISHAFTDILLGARKDVSFLLVNQRNNENTGNGLTWLEKSACLQSEN